MFASLILTAFLAFALLVFFAASLERIARLFDVLNWPLVSLVLLFLTAGGWYLTRG